MNKAITKFISLILAMTLLSSMLCVNVSAEGTISVSSTEATRIEGENFTEKVGGGYRKSNYYADGHSSAFFIEGRDPATDPEHYTSYVVDVELAGNYSVTAIATKIKNAFVKYYMFFMKS